MAREDKATHPAAAPAKSHVKEPVKEVEAPPASRKLTPGEISAQFSRAVVTVVKRDEQGLRSGQGSGFMLA
jgi:hypothetical protein